jgi:hypothetical protein
MIEAIKEGVGEAFELIKLIVSNTQTDITLNTKFDSWNIIMTELNKLCLGILMVHKAP